MPRLLRCRFWKSLPSRGPPMPSPSSSAGGISILITSAPQSASWRTAVGPARTRVRSMTVRCESAVEAGMILSLHCAPRRIPKHDRYESQAPARFRRRGRGAFRSSRKRPGEISVEADRGRHSFGCRRRHRHHRAHDDGARAGRVRHRARRREPGRRQRRRGARLTRRAARATATRSCSSRSRTCSPSCRASRR